VGKTYSFSNPAPLSVTSNKINQLQDKLISLPLQKQYMKF
jgi:hypothetical protein